MGEISVQQYGIVGMLLGASHQHPDTVDENVRLDLSHRFLYRVPVGHVHYQTIARQGSAVYHIDQVVSAHLPEIIVDHVPGHTGGTE